MAQNTGPILLSGSVDGFDACSTNPCFNVFMGGTEPATPAQPDSTYRAFFENAVIGMFRSTPGGRFLAVNNALAHMLGYESAADLVARVTDIGKQLYVDPEERVSGVSAATETREHRGTEIALRRADGTVIRVLEQARTVFDENDVPLYFEGTLEQISERKNRENRVDVESDPTASGDPKRTRLRAARMESALHRIAGELALIGMDQTLGIERLDPSELEGFKSLTRREVEVLRAIVSGDRVRMIAKSLGLAPNTVRNHLKSIFIKLKIRSQTELIEKLKKRD